MLTRVSLQVNYTGSINMYVLEKLFNERIVNGPPINYAERVSYESRINKFVGRNMLNAHTKCDLD